MPNTTKPSAIDRADNRDGQKRAMIRQDTVTEATSVNDQRYITLAAVTASLSAFARDNQMIRLQPTVKFGVTKTAAGLAGASTETGGGGGGARGDS